DKQGRVMTSGVLQPAVLVQAGDSRQARKCISGRPAGHEAAAGSLTFAYEGVNRTARLSMRLRFDDYGFWMGQSLTRALLRKTLWHCIILPRGEVKRRARRSIISICFSPGSASPQA